MKTLWVGLVLLSMLTLACAASAKPSADTKSNQDTHQSGQSSEGQVSSPATSQSSHGAAILSRAEADSLSIRGDSLLAQSDVGDIKVGAGGYDLIYVLVVVLLVVLIIAVVR